MEAGAGLGLSFRAGCLPIVPFPMMQALKRFAIRVAVLNLADSKSQAIARRYSTPLGTVF